MSDSIPSAHADADTEHQQLPANPEDRKAAAALSALNATEIGPGSTPKQSTSTADQEALGKAMSRLEIAAGQGGAAKTKTGEAQKEVVKKKAVRVAAEDVNLLVEELDLTKIKATELLRSCDGDAKRAIKAFITPAVGA